MKLSRASLLVCAWLASSSAFAAEYRSVGVAPAVLYDAPTERGRKIAVAPRNMPLEVLQSSGSFTRVKDVSGEFSWIATRDLVPRRHLVVTVASARVHQAPEDSAPVVFFAERNVLLELSDLPANGWVKVRHAEGQSGFVRAADVWGD